jgi:PAS domain S-box-containing protein
MWLTLKRWYSLEIYEQEEDRRIARILLGFIFIYEFVILFTLLMGLAWGDGSLTSSLILGFCYQIVPLFFLLRGNFSVAGFSMIGLLIVSATIYATLGQGIHDYVVMAYPVVIVFAGLVEKQRGLMTATLSSLAALAWLILGEKYGWFVVQKIPAPTWFDLILTSLMIAFIALAVDMLVVNLKDRLAQLHHELAERNRVEEALKASEENYRLLVHNMNAGVFQTTLDGTFLHINNAMVEMAGYDNVAELMSKPATVLYADAEDRERLIGALMQSGEIKDMEMHVVKKNKILHWVSLNAVVLRDKDGKPEKILGVATDITNRKQIEVALKENEERYRALVSNAPVVIYMTDEKGVFTLSEGQGLGKLGLQPGQVVGLSVFDVYRDYPSVVDALKSALDGHIQRTEVEVQGIVFDAIFSPVLDQQGKVVKVVGVSTDVTERVRAQEALKQSEARSRAMLEAIPDQMFLQDRAGVYIDYHAANPQLLVTPPELFLGRTTREVLPPAQGDALQSKFDLAFQTGEIQTHEYILDVPYGSRYFETRMNAYDEDRLLSIVRDITERKQTEQKLMMMEEIQRVLMNATRSTSILLLDHMGTILLINEYGAQLIGRRPDELVGHPIFDVFSVETSDDRLLADHRKQRFDEVCRTAVRVDFEDFRRGSWFENSLYPIVDEAGKVVQVAVYARNITRRKQNEQLLRESEQRYRALAEAAHDMIFVIGQDDHIAYANSYAASQLGERPETLIGQPRSHWFGRPDSDRMRKGLKFVFETGEPNYSEADVVFPTGAVFLSTWLAPLRDQNGAVTQVLGVSRDISNQKKLQDALKEANLNLSAIVEEQTAELRASRDQLRTLSQKVIFAQEEERLRLSRDLHDDAGQALIGLRLNLESIYNDLPLNLRKIRRQTMNALALIDQTVNRVRMLAYNLRPPVLDILGVNLGIKELCAEFSRQTGLDVEYMGTELKKLPDDISISLYRFVQEALTNAAKHAHARKVKVIFEYHNEMIKVSVEDDGQGLSAVTEKSGLGMVGIRERFNNLGGWLEIAPVVTGGLLVQVFLPWKNTGV